MSPGKRKGPDGTGPDAKTSQPAPEEYPEAPTDIGFWAKAAAGKVRPRVREPEISHLDCYRSCCRGWSA